ncbi:hypothetical protein PT2222_330065 [Paraburkholderia tropica]
MRRSAYRSDPQPSDRCTSERPDSRGPRRVAAFALRTAAPTRAIPELSWCFRRCCRHWTFLLSKTKTAHLIRVRRPGMGYLLARILEASLGMSTNQLSRHISQNEVREKTCYRATRQQAADHTLDEKNGRADHDYRNQDHRQHLRGRDGCADTCLTCHDRACDDIRRPAKVIDEEAKQDCDYDNERDRERHDFPLTRIACD